MKNRTELRFTLPEKSAQPDRVLALLNGRVAPGQPPESITPDEWARQAALGSPEAQYALARYLTAAASSSADNRTAVKWLKKAAQKKHAASEHLLGVLTARAQGVRADPEKAVALFRSAAIMGNADAQYDLARALSWGFGCGADPHEALTWFRLAAAQGHIRSELAVGLAYANGTGCDIDLRQAASWLRKAALAHDVQAQKALAALYLRPDNPLSDNREAFRWLSEAARSSDPEAAYRLSLFYWSGRATGEPNYPQAFSWAKRAALSGNIAALLLLSRLSESGQGVPQNLTGALALVKVARRLAEADPQGENAKLSGETVLRERELCALLSQTQIQAAALLCNDCPGPADILHALFAG